MQIDALKSVNFRGSNALMVIPQGANRESDKKDAFAADFQPSLEVAGRKPESEAFSALQFEENVKKYLDTVDKANSNVRIATIVSSVALFIGIMAKGGKVIDPVINGLVTSGEAIAKGSVGLAGRVFKKINAAKLKDSIAEGAAKLRTTSPESQKMLNGIQSFTDKVFGEGKGKKVVDKLNRFGITNYGTLVRTAIAGAVALGATDKFADKVEGKLDEAEIQNAKSSLIGEGISVAADFLETVL